MVLAIAARRDGDAFQARLFWRKAASMLDPESHIVRVGFEIGPSGFDDIWVEYDPARARKDQHGLPLIRDHIQSKWHVTPGGYGHADLTNPEFINANKRSLLERALAAQRSHAPAGQGARFSLVTNWRIALSDPLRQLVHQKSHTLRLDRLFGVGGEASAMGKLRKLWRDHLGLDDDQLRALTGTLALSEATDSLDDCREALDPLFRIGGLRRVPASDSAFIYDDVAFQWLSQGRLEFDREKLQAACQSEGLIAGSEDAARSFGVKSFEHATDKLEDRCTAVLDLVPNFDDRQIRPEADWADTLFPELKDFLLAAATSGERLRLILDAHLTLSFAAGAILNVKSGRIVELEQRTLGKNIWAPDDLQPDASWPAWDFRVVEIDSKGGDLAVAVSLTHQIASEVEAYLRRSVPQVGRLVVAQPGGAPGRFAVSCGRHACDLAETLAARVKLEKSKISGRGRLHLFVAGPGGFSFYLGQHQAALGDLIIYEYDFEGANGGSYEPSLALPIRRAK